MVGDGDWAGSIRVRCSPANAKHEEITFEVPWVFGASWSSLKLMSVEIMPDDLINWGPIPIFDWVSHPIFDWRYLYPKNWYSIIIYAGN